MAIETFNPELLTHAVRRALGSDQLEIRDWQHVPLTYGAINPVSGGLYRFSGQASDGRKALPWSMVLKVVSLPDGSPAADPSHHSYWKREMFAYQSALLQELPEGLSAPRCFGVIEPAPNLAWLWLEEITDRFGAEWPLDQYLTTARHLGRFNGAYLAGRSLPSYPWLSQGWLRSWVAERGRAIALLDEPDLWEHPLVRPAFPRPVADRLRRLWSEHEALLEVLDQLPQTLCHWDAWRPNLFARLGADGREETVAIDWAFVGPGAVGTEMGQLVAMCLIRGTVAPGAIREFAAQALELYLAGLRDAGWRGEARDVELGAAALIALRWGLMLATILSHALDERRHAWVERTFGQPIAAHLQHWGAISGFLLDQAEVARPLID